MITPFRDPFPIYIPNEHNEEPLRENGVSLHLTHEQKSDQNSTHSPLSKYKICSRNVRNPNHVVRNS